MSHRHHVRQALVPGAQSVVRSLQRNVPSEIPHRISLRVLGIVTLMKPHTSVTDLSRTSRLRSGVYIMSGWHCNVMFKEVPEDPVDLGRAGEGIHGHCFGEKRSRARYRTVRS